MPTVHTCFLLFSGSLKVDSSSLRETWVAWSSISWKVDDSYLQLQALGSMWQTTILGSSEPFPKPVTLTCESECHDCQHPEFWQDVGPCGGPRAGFGISSRGRVSQDPYLRWGNPTLPSHLETPHCVEDHSWPMEGQGEAQQGCFLPQTGRGN